MEAAVHEPGGNEISGQFAEAQPVMGYEPL